MFKDPIISASELRSSKAIVLFDCRVGPDARARYEAGHLPEAIFADLDSDLSQKQANPAQGGRHPLPPVETFAARLGSWGVTPASHVVIYDEQGGANAAARLWWMLRSVGHERVQVLDGGLAQALAEGFVLTSAPSTPRAAPPYPAVKYQLPTVDIDHVAQARLRQDTRVLDVRAAVRFRGEQETFDPVAGHIPFAVNVPLSENLENGRFKSAEALRALYEPLHGEASHELIVHCGSGVTACHTLLALERAGLPGGKLYVGSWSEWCRDPSRPRAP
jgi:thiosulfate/3-mercaptopyruvate sulfurtransferase